MRASEREVRRRGLLALQADQVVRHDFGSQAGALEEVLPEQEGAVELPGREPHVTVKVLVSSVGPPPSPPDGSSVIATKV